MKRIFLICLLIFCFASCTPQENMSPEGAQHSALEMRGVDLSFYDEINTLGGKYKYSGQDFSIFEILKSANVNWVRLRLWVNPQNEWCNLEHTIKIAKLIKQNNFKFLLDIHYSDTWADPSQQTIPSDWGAELAQKSTDGQKVTYLTQKISDYTKEVLNAFIAQGITPDMVQTGNEITNGMLWPYGTTTGGNCENLMAFLDAATKAVREKAPDAKIMLHLDRGGDNTTASWWYGVARNKNIDYDVIGLSYYPFFHGTDLGVVENNLKNLRTTFSKEVCIVETSYPWSCGWNDNTPNQVGEGNDLLDDCPATKEGQQKYLKKLCELVEAAGGTGVFYWGADSISVTGYQNTLENQAWFDFNNNWTGIAF